MASMEARMMRSVLISPPKKDRNQRDGCWQLTMTQETVGGKYFLPMPCSHNEAGHVKMEILGVGVGHSNGDVT